VVPVYMGMASNMGMALEGEEDMGVAAEGGGGRGHGGGRGRGGGSKWGGSTKKC